MRQAPLINLDLIEQTWAAMRATMLDTFAKRDAHARALTAAFELRSNRGEHTLGWGRGDAESIAKEFHSIAERMARHAQQVFSVNGLDAKLDFSEAINEYIYPEGNRSHGYEHRMEVLEKHIHTLSVHALWDRLCAAYPEGSVEALATLQTFDALRNAFSEFSRARHGEQAPIQRVAGRAILSLTLYSGYSDTWQLDYSRRERLSHAFSALSNALAAQGDANAADALRNAGGWFLNRAEQHGWRYTSRMRQEISDDITLTFFKDKVQFSLSQRLTTAVMLILAEHSQQQEAA